MFFTAHFPKEEGRFPLVKIKQRSSLEILIEHIRKSWASSRDQGVHSCNINHRFIHCIQILDFIKYRKYNKELFNCSTFNIINIIPHLWLILYCIVSIKIYPFTPSLTMLRTDILIYWHIWVNSNHSYVWIQCNIGESKSQ